MNHLASLAIVLLCFLGTVCSTVPCQAESLVFLRGGALWKADVRGMQQEQLGSFKDPRAVALSPDGTLAAVTAGNNKETGLSFLYLTPTTPGQGRTRRVFIAGVPGVCCPSFAPDGASLLLVTAQSVHTGPMDDMTLGTMAVSQVGLDGTMLRQLLTAKDAILDAGYVYGAPVFAPDGKRFAVQQSGSDVSGGFTVHDLQGNTLFSFPKKADDYRPYWSPQFLPDGETLLCWSPAIEPSGESEIALVHMPSGKRTVIATGSRPSLVRKGTAMVYERCASPWNDTACDIWLQELRPGAPAMRILTNAHAPAGTYPSR